MKIISTPKSPRPIGPYSQCIVSQGLVFCSGQIALDTQTGSLVAGDVKAQTRQVLSNLSEILKAVGTSMDLVIKTTVYLQNLNDFSTFNEEYELFFSNHKPARSTVQVARLPKNALIEIDLIAEMV